MKKLTSSTILALLITIQIPSSFANSNDTIYVANNGNGLVRGFASNGVDLGNITTVPAPFAQGIAMDASNNIYVVSVSGDYIRRYSPSGDDLGIFANSGINDARALAFDSSGNLYVANAGTDNPNNSVRRFSPTGVDLGNFISTGLVNSTGMAFDEAGNLYVANYSLNHVKKFAPDGTYLGVAISAGLSQPIGLAVIPQAQGGGFYVATDFSGKVIKYDAAGNIVSTLTSGTLGRLHYLALDSVGNVYVSRFTANAIRKFSPAGQDLGDFAVTGLNGPAGIVVGPPPGPSCQDTVAALQAQVATLQAQLTSSNAYILELEGELSTIEQSLQRLTGFLQVTFRNPQFEIPGNTTSSAVNNVVIAIENLDRGHSLGIYKNLGGK